MKKFDLNQIVSILANIAVFGGLVFLGYETRQNTIQLRAEASYAITEGLNFLNSGEYNNPQLADLLNRGQQDLSSLTEVERIQFFAYEFARVNLAIHVQILEQDGVSEVQFPYLEFLIKDFHSKPGLQQFLVEVKDVWVGAPELYEMLVLNDK